jgi:NhaA family Na+:H+ antiporter
MTPRDAAPRTTWRHSDRLVPRTIVQPIFRLLEFETFAGSIMIAAAALALIWANSPWYASYDSLWATPLEMNLGNLIHLDGLTLRNWVNDAAMALFFLLAGLEIKRQLVLGELRDRRAAALPALAALGGMVVPALFYLLLNAGHPGQDGWGIPVATDIAFAVGVVALAGNRIPTGARIFILTLAVVDDIGGIVVIALFYADDVRLSWLLVAAATVGLTVVANRVCIRSLVPYVALGITCWFALHEAGVEAAIVGVVFGLLTPAHPFHRPDELAPIADRVARHIDLRHADGIVTDDERDADELEVEDLARLAVECTSPLERLENRLAAWVTLVVVPLFAFANTGVRIDLGGLDNRVVAGVIVGLVLGKGVGVTLATWLAIRTGVGTLPAGLSLAHIVALAFTAGIGFTVSLFITSLSFTDDALLASAKLGVIIAAVLAGTIGLLLLRRTRGAERLDERSVPAAAAAPAVGVH